MCDFDAETRPTQSKINIFLTYKVSNYSEINSGPQGELIYHRET